VGQTAGLVGSGVQDKNMTRKQIILFIALGGFIVSFLLTAVRVSGFDIPGYICALSALSAVLAPWDKESMQSVATKPMEYVGIIGSGLINPLFLAALTLLQRKKTERLGKKLRAIVLLMLPFCWLYFWGDKMYPSVGYFLWTAAMIVALFSSSSNRDCTTTIADAKPKKIGPEKQQELPLAQLSWTIE
jgi:hypothetical protein